MKWSRLGEYAAGSAATTLIPASIYFHLAWRNQLSVAGMLGLALVALMQAMALMASALFMVLFGIVGPCLAMCSVCLGGGIRTGEAKWFASVADWCLLLLPNGWPNASVLHALIGQRLFGWLFLVPMALTALYLVYAIAQPLTIVEYRFEGPDPVAAVLSDGHELAIEPFRRKPNLATSEPPAETIVTPSTEAELRERVSRDQLLAEPRWRATLWLDRLVSYGLTPRQRTILYVGGGSFGAYTREFTIYAGGLVAASIFAWFMAAKDSLPMFTLGVLYIMVFTMMGGRGENRAQGRAFPCNCFPIGMKELLWASLKGRLLVLPFWLLLTVLAARCVSVQHGLSLPYALNSAAWPIGVYWAFRPLISLLLYSNGTDDTEIPRFRVRAYIVAVLAIGAPLLSLFGAFSDEIFGFERLAIPWIGVGILALTAALSWRYYLWAFHHLPIDVVVRKEPTNRLLR